MKVKYIILAFIILLFIGTVNATDNIDDLNETNIKDINSNEFIKEYDIYNNENKIIANDTVLYYHDGTKLVATLIDSDNKPLFNQSIDININNVTYFRKTDQSGMVNLSLNLNSGKYQATIFNTELNVSTIIDVTILSTLDSSDVKKYYKNDTQYYVTVYDNNGNPLNNTSISININGIIYDRNTDINGIAKLTINLNPGNYILTVINNLNGEKITNNILVLTTILSKDIDKYYKNDTQYHVTILNDVGSPLTNTEINMNINGKFYTKTTDGKGIANLSINLNPGTYILTVNHPITGLQISNTIKVISTVISKDLEMIYKEDSFNITVLDNKGNPIDGESVKFNVNGIIYDKISDSKGIAKLNINLNPGTYVITSYFNGYAVSNIINIYYSYNSILNAKDMHLIYGENRAFEVSLINYKGIPINGAEIKITIHSYDISFDTVEQDSAYSHLYTNTYTKITDINGCAYLDINLRQGIYVIETSYNGNNDIYGAEDISNTITILGLEGEMGRGNSAYNGDSLGQYLYDSSNAQSTNSIIVNLANEITADCDTITEKAYAIFNYVSNTIEYELYSNTKYGALGTLQLGKGNCVDQSHLIVALARAVNLPARYGNGPNHVWTQILNQEEGIWLIADTTTQRCSMFGIWNIYTTVYSYYAN